MKNQLIQIGESLHASIPKCGAAMRNLLALGPGCWTTPSESLSFLSSLISAQVDSGADYIAINVDAFGESDPQLAVELMRHFVELVRRHSRGVPPCIDSSNDDVLQAGLQQWYKTADKPRPPLVNSVKTYTMTRVLPWRKQYAFKLICLLIEESASPVVTAGTLYQLAVQLFNGATQHGFAPDDLFFDSTVFPLAIDMPMMPGQSGYTYNAFETIRRIKSAPAMAGVHCSLGLSNCVKDLPARKIGVCRAYLACAMRCGLDAAIVNVAHNYGSTPPDQDLLELVEAFAAQDGRPENTDRAMQLMGDFCRNSKPA